MKILTLCILALSVGISAQAQSTTASLNITFTDVQSVKFDEVSSQQDLAPAVHDGSKNTPLQMLSRSTSQVKRIDSKSAEYEKLYKELSVTLGSAAIYANAPVPAVKRSLRGKEASPSHIIYQVDPR